MSYLEGLPEPHILVDEQYRIVASNTAYRSEFSPDADVIGRRCYEVSHQFYEVSHQFNVPCDQAGESCPRARLQETGVRERVLHLHHTPHGEAYVNIELVPVRDGQGHHAWFVEKMEPLRVARGEPAADGLIGRSSAFRQMLESVARVGPSHASVLLLGESGPGKELEAGAVHKASGRASHAFVVVDCASKEQEGDVLRRALMTHRGSRRELAEKLGDSIRTLYRKLGELDGGNL
ncbi:sigma 54-interacting transcriptional regulator [Bradyrhizobium sp. HKCCYLS2038]|uniref:sigma 54-interacting transcriptional regulator n=1 Tax=unclassified Bradyrhizobium TaxID=2631580 RepID=UPI003EB80433